ncbi:MAG TPA: Crp/Fnr family transcriptional regulator [Vicinamibacterales bacterium]|nr:Crp/Fnr family transcriptional regulator [Vicinamibacterales bacterium]
MSLDKGASLFDIGDVVQYAYFPTDGLVSLVALTAEGGTVELTTVAREGVVGLSVLLQATIAPHQAMVRLAGAALRLSTHTLRAEIERHEIFRAALLAYANRASVEVAQAVVCQCFHSVLQRLSRWLLMASDRTGTDTLELTQESLAQVLGVLRPVVTKAAIELQDAAAIRYRHGRLFLVNRPILERSACECYELQRRRAQTQPAALDE